MGGKGALEDERKKVLSLFRGLFPTHAACLFILLFFIWNRCGALAHVHMLYTYCSLLILHLIGRRQATQLEADIDSNGYFDEMMRSAMAQLLISLFDEVRLANRLFCSKNQHPSSSCL